MSSSNFFISAADAQSKSYQSQEGIIIYPDEDSIPQDVLLFVATKDSAENFPTFVSRVLSDTAIIGRIVYFQGMRWKEPELQEKLLSVEYLKAEIQMLDYVVLVSRTRQRFVRMICAKIIFDTTYWDKLDFDNDDSIMNINIIINSKLYNKQVKWTQKEWGVPTYFQTIK